MTQTMSLSRHTMNMNLCRIQNLLNLCIHRWWDLGKQSILHLSCEMLPPTHQKNRNPPATPLDWRNHDQNICLWYQISYRKKCLQKLISGKRVPWHHAPPKTTDPSLNNRNGQSVRITLKVCANVVYQVFQRKQKSHPLQSSRDRHQ